MMVKLIVTVDKLNKRKKIPAKLPDQESLAGVVLKGFTFEGEEVLNVPIPGPEKWYKDRDGYFYWGGGVKEVNASSQSNLSPGALNFQYDLNKMSWGHELYEIPTIWNDLKTKGNGVTIAVIDTGIDINHDDLSSIIDSRSKSVTGSDSISDSDGHGTNMAGIIAATGSSKVFGVAPDSKIIVIKASEDLYGADPKLFAEGLNYLSAIPEVDIISLSFVLKDEKSLQDAITKCLNAKKIILCSIGNSRDKKIPLGPDPDTFPACYDQVIAIGAFDQHKQICNFSNWNSHLQFLAPGDYSVMTAGLNNSVEMGAGTSIATAFTAGCLGLMLSYAKLNAISVADCIKAIRDTCDDTGPSIGKDIQSGHGLMNFRNAILKIKKL